MSQVNFPFIKVLDTSLGNNESRHSLGSEFGNRKSKSSFAHFGKEKQELTQSLLVVEESIEKLQNLNFNKENKSELNKKMEQLENRREELKNRIEVINKTMNAAKRREFSNSKSSRFYQQNSKIGNTKVAVISKSKQRTTKIVKLSNTLYNQVLISCSDPKKKVSSKDTIRCNTLYKHVSKIYVEYEKKIKANPEQDPVPLKNYVCLFLKNQSSLKKGLGKRYKSVS